ncbi:MAG: hypothetical protein AAB214_21375, partial [Fibrobacterota bacterium]
LGALAGDVGFLPTASYCWAIRGDWLNLTAELCGSRLGRDLLVQGGVRFDLNPPSLQTIDTRDDTTDGHRDVKYRLLSLPISLVEKVADAVRAVG